MPKVGAGPAPGLLAACERARARGRPERDRVALLLRSSYRPWIAQTWLHRSTARLRILIAGRGVGKTHGCAYELLQLVLSAAPGSEGAVLCPTYTHAEAAIAKLREIADEAVPGAEWRQQAKRLLLPGGRSIRVYSADRKETVRGPSIVAIWIDEAAYLHYKAIEAAFPAIRSNKTQCTLLLSTTPAGKNWAFKWWEEALTEAGMERMRMRATESPFQDQFFIDKARRLMSPEKFAQEYLAEFVDNLLLAFPDRSELYVDSFPSRKERARCWMGVDIGRKDFTTCFLMNEWQEGELIGRWNEDTPGFKPATYWAQTQERVTALAKLHGAAVVVDTGGAGGAPGSVLAEHLRGEGIEVMEVKTNQQGTKAQVVEQAIADVQWRKVKVLRSEHQPQLDYELSKFMGVKRVLHGTELMVYEGPQVEGEHDDCVIAFCLANWGRVHGEEKRDPCAGDYSGWDEGVDLADGSGQGGAKPDEDLGDWAPVVLALLPALPPPTRAAA